MAKKKIIWNTDESDTSQVNQSVADANYTEAKVETPTTIVNRNDTEAPATIAAPQAGTLYTSNTGSSDDTKPGQTPQQPQQSAPKIGGVTQPGSAINPFMRAAVNGSQSLMVKDANSEADPNHTASQSDKVDKDGNPVTAEDVTAKAATPTDIVGENESNAPETVDSANSGAVGHTSTDEKNDTGSLVATKTPIGYKYRYIDPATGKEKIFDSKVDFLAYIHKPPTSEEDKKKEEKRERRRSIIAAIGDGLSSLANLYFTGKGALSADFKPGMTEAAKKRAEAMRARWQAEKDKYDAIMLKGNEADSEAYYKALAAAIAKAKADREAADWEADQPVKAAERGSKLHKYAREKELRPKQDEIDNLKLDNDYADEENRQKTGIDRATQYKQDQQNKRQKYSVDHRRSGGSSDGSSKKKNEIKTPNGRIYPDNASVRQAYSRLAEAGLVSGTANSIEGMITAIQDYYDGGGRNYTETNGFLGKKRTKVGKGRGSDSEVDADIDDYLGVGKKNSGKKKISY